ncbi:hypothetical protein SUNI508_13904 [Seiridium unicorne]|uniref:Uncharacterized protein n=1 Tax=Seiridium unicorne TaxID=138068 RepID=A0ABR2VA28_9PEZI
MLRHSSLTNDIQNGDSFIDWDGLPKRDYTGTVSVLLPNLIDIALLQTLSITTRPRLVRILPHALLKLDCFGGYSDEQIPTSRTILLYAYVDVRDKLIGKTNGAESLPHDEGEPYILELLFALRVD